MRQEEPGAASGIPARDDATIEPVVESPVLIVGAPRSGTTWLQRLLLADPRIAGGQESHFFTAFVPLLLGIDSQPRGSRPVGLSSYWTRDDFAREVRRLWRLTMWHTVAESPRASLLLEKTPGHAFYVPEIATLLPRARFIHLVRDSRAVVASLLAAGRSPWGRTWAPRSTRDAARRWRSLAGRAHRAGLGLPPQRFLTVRYEGLRERTFEEMSRIYGWLGLDAASEALHRAIEENRFGRQAQRRGDPIPLRGELAGADPREPEGFFRHGESDRWRRDLHWHQRLVVWRITRSLMKELGYF
jgi:hypothetical protein